MLTTRSPRCVVLEKPCGLTPLEALTMWKESHPEFADVPATYAGRLDPLASGKLLILLGDECKKREQYTKLNKEYEIEVVLDIGTDTGDALGMAEVMGAGKHPDEEAVRAVLSALRGSHQVPYPAFSSKTVNGKPLFQYALEGTLRTIQVPTHIEHIYQLKLLGYEPITVGDLKERIEDKLAVVPQSDEPSKALGADFRQESIRARWNEVFASLPRERSFILLTLRVTCASGTYMRTLADRIGAALSTRGFALSIHRTRIGRYVPLGPFGFWLRKYK